ncbi:MAG: anaerobic nitric oxide reductase flavorubredoxin [Bacteroidales bacterium]|nr:anaerobic nitric oxide reductase flavorubredoxin [Bacteroidales bacterium]
MSKIISDNITWVGKVDWELTMFHGNELSTKRGSSYNAYLVRGLKKTVLLDTVWGPYDKEFVSRLKEEVPLDQIDAIIMQHNETDHSGALAELMREIPDTPVYCTAKGEAILRGHYHQDWNFVNVKTGDVLELGGDERLTFVEAPMLHWPDTMFTYYNGGGGVLFSNDGFGQHYASENLFNDEVPECEMMYEALKYYANILSTYSPMVSRKVKEILGMNLPLAMICPSHGVIWRKNPAQIVEKYLQWSDSYQEDQVTIVYDTMWNSTRLMAEALARGIKAEAPATTVKILNAAKEDKNDILTEVFRSKAVLVGSPTINYGYSFAIAGILEMLKGMRLKKKKAAAFGSYGWSGEGAKLISAALSEAGFEVADEGCRTLWVPDAKALGEVEEYGKAFALKL